MLVSFIDATSHECYSHECLSNYEEEGSLENFFEDRPRFDSAAPLKGRSISSWTNSQVEKHGLSHLVRQATSE